MSNEDLIARLTDAAAAALEDLAPVLEHERSKLRSVMLELSVANNGGVVECNAWIERRANVKRLTA
jgi:hypothetical protein